MSPKFEIWKTRVNNLPQPESDFEKWLFVSIASVLLGGKSGELLNIDAKRYGVDFDRLTERIIAISRSWGFLFIVICRWDTCAKIVIYDRVKVQDALSQASDWALSELDYQNDISPEEFLEEIGRRWRNTGMIPHEIGIALGYPIKDVLGYMGLMPLQCTGTCGWRIYGDPLPSLHRGHQYRRARKQAITFITN